jgi:sugar lactone lactonase YvrE
VTTREIASLLLALAALGAPVATRGAVTGLKHEKSIYVDDREGLLKEPEGVACADNGTVVVADTGNGRLLTFTWKDGSLKGGKQIKLPQIPYPVRVEIDGSGNVLVLDRKLKKIARLDVSGGFSGYIEMKGATSSASIVPGSFRADGTGLWVLDLAGRRVLAVDAAGKVTRDIALPATGEFTDILVVNDRVYALDAIGRSMWALEKGATAFQEVAKDMKSRVNFPIYIASDQRGRVLVVDENGHGIVVLGQDTTFQGRTLGMGWSDGMLYYPQQICVTREGETFVADRGNNRVQVFSLGR